MITAIAGYILFPLIGYFLISSIISQLFGGSLVPGDNNNPNSGWIADEKVMGDARDAKRLTTMSQIQLALELYKNDKNAYPQSLNDLVTEGIIGAMPFDPKADDDLVAGSPTPSGDVGPWYYHYAASPTLDKYHLGAVLEDPENRALCSDADFDSSSNPNGGFNGGGVNPDLTCDGLSNNDDSVRPIYDLAN